MINFKIDKTGPLFEDSIRIDKLIDEAIEDTADYAQNRVRNLTPVRTGRLRAAWNIRPISNKLSILNDLAYAPFIERKVGMVRQNIPAIEKELGRNINKAIDRLK